MHGPDYRQQQELDEQEQFEACEKEMIFSLISYESETGNFFWKKSSGNKMKGKQAGYIRPDGYVRIQINKYLYLAHRLAWLFINGYIPQTDIDHINGDRSDNRIINLREVAHRTNMQNSRTARVNNKSGFLGVSWHKASSSWVAQININGKNKHLGCFKTKDEAHEKYLSVKRKSHDGCTI